MTFKLTFAKVSALIAVLYGAALSIGLAPNPFGSNGNCSVSEHDVLVSPDGNWQVFQTSKSCKNRPQEIQVWLSSRKQQDKTEQIFYAIYPSDVELTVRWKSASKLVLGFPEHVKPASNPGTFKGVNVTYVPKPPQGA